MSKGFNSKKSDNKSEFNEHSTYSDGDHTRPPPQRSDLINVYYYYYYYYYYYNNNNKGLGFRSDLINRFKLKWIGSVSRVFRKSLHLIHQIQIYQTRGGGGGVDLCGPKAIRRSAATI